MRYPIALVLVFMLGALPILMPSEQTVGYDMTTAGVVDESTDVADTPEVDVEAVEISGTLGAVETTTIAEDAAVSGPSVDGAEWTARFEALWLTKHDEPVIFADRDQLVDWSDAFNLAYGVLLDAISVEIYQEFTVPGEYWLEIDLYQNDVPALKSKEFEALFYDAIEVGVLVERDTITLGKLNELLNTIREQFAEFGLPDAENTSAGYYFSEDTYISLWYDAENLVMRCRVCFE